MWNFIKLYKIGCTEEGEGGGRVIIEGKRGENERENKKEEELEEGESWEERGGIL